MSADIKRRRKKDMAKASLMDKELFVRGMSRTIGSRDKHNTIRSEALKQRIAYAGSQMQGNTIAKKCGEAMNKRFADSRGPARGKAFEACERVEGYKQLHNKLSKAGALAAVKA